MSNCITMIEGDGFVIFVDSRVELALIIKSNAKVDVSRCKTRINSHCFVVFVDRRV